MAWWVPLAMMAGQKVLEKSQQDTVRNSKLMMPEYQNTYSGKLTSGQEKPLYNVKTMASLMQSLFGMKQKPDIMEGLDDSHNIGGSFYDL
jgi:hypothetical protein